MIEREYLDVVKQLRALDKQTDELKARKTALEAELLEKWSAEGVDGMKLDGHALYIRDSAYASMPQGKDAAVALLQQTEHRDLVQLTVNSNSLSALVRELVATEGLPPDWGGVIEAGHRIDVGVRKSN